jgi:glycine C-acetyltransferase
MPFLEDVQAHIETLKQAGTYKAARHLNGPMQPHTPMQEAGGEVLVLSSNNYLGLANHPHVVAGAQKALEVYGAGTASVRFICGTMSLHEQLEQEIASFHGVQASLTYSSCWAANTGLFPVICKEGDALISDELNHASIIDGCRMVGKGVNRAVYKHSDMSSLEATLAEYADAPNRFVVTDGVFSMEGDICKLPEIVRLCERYDAVLIVDDSHGVGVMGPTGKGVAEHFGLMDKVDITTGTLGKALGGAAGGYVAGPKAVIDMLFQASRPQIFSNAISPATAGAALAAIQTLENTPELVGKLHENVRYLRAGLKKLGLNPLDGESAIVPIVVGETSKAIAMSDALLKEGVFVTGFGFPVVPEGTARIRVQISAAHTKEDLDLALSAFEKVM